MVETGGSRLFYSLTSEFAAWSGFVSLGSGCFSVLGLDFSSRLVGGFGGIASLFALSALVFLSHRKQVSRSLLQVGQVWSPLWKSSPSHIRFGLGTQTQIGAMSLPQPRQFSIAGRSQLPHFSAVVLTLSHRHWNLVFRLASQSHTVVAMLAEAGKTSHFWDLRFSND
jgi:hypothetical protein